MAQTTPSSRPDRAYAYFDGQNLFGSARAAFNASFPDYDPVSLALAVSRERGVHLQGVYFYTGMPEPESQWHRFWTAKLSVLGRRGVNVFTRPVQYSMQRIRLPGGGETSVRLGREKAIDVRIALDMVTHAINRDYDTAILFSQDQDLAEAVATIRTVATSQARKIDVVCAYPVSETSYNRRGVNGTSWFEIDGALYRRCRDPRDYRETRSRAPERDAPQPTPLASPVAVPG